MAHLIDKDALVAEIERRKNQFMSQADSFHIIGMEEKKDYYAALASNMYSILSFLDTLEVKEVDLEIEQRIKECPYRQVSCTMYEDKLLGCTCACSWIVDYPRLKELKAQKGE